MRSVVIAVVVLVSAMGIAVVLARPEPVPKHFEPPPRSEASQQRATTSEPEAPAESTEADPGDDPPHPGYSLTRMDLEQGLLKVRARAVACKDEATPDPLLLKIVIAPSGTVSSVQLPQDVRSTPAGECVARAVKSASFPSWAPTEKVTQVEWSYPLRFDAAD